MEYNKQRAKILGIPFGTAANRLRKLVLFSVLQRHQENFCIICGKEILEAKDLSIEHIRPWEGRSAELFWDLNNIAFSHLACNKPHWNGKVPMQAPEGKSWCYKCKDFKPVDNFHKNTSLVSGLADRCKICKHHENSTRVR